MTSHPLVTFLKWHVEKHRFCKTGYRIFSGIRPALHRSHLKMVTTKFITGQSRLIRCIKNVFFRYQPVLFKGLKFQKLLNNMQFLYSRFDNLLQPVWLPEILKKLMLGKVVIAPLSQLKEQNSKVSLKAFLKSYDLNLDFNKVNTYDFTTI